MLLLCYRTDKPGVKAKRYCKYSEIARALKLPYNLVRHLALYRSKMKSITIWKRKIHKLSQGQIKFLVDPNTLKSWTGYSLSERTALF